jgi:hypothetical protein
MSVEIRIPAGRWDALWEEVRREAPYEPVVFGLVSNANVSGKRLILVKDLLIPPDGLLQSGTGHGARWPPAYNIALINEAVERNLGVMIFHYHGGKRLAQMSTDDTQSAHQLLPAFQLVVGNRPHGSIVLGNNSVAGLIAIPGAAVLDDHVRVRVFGNTITSYPTPEASESDRLLHRRRPLVENRVSRSIVRNAVVAVVGLSGGGSQIATQLACLGVGEIIGIDPQCLERENLKASDEFTRLDIAFRRKKAAAVKSKVRAISRETRFTPIEALIPEPQALAGLKRADIIVGCVNNLHARVDIQEIASRYCIPYVDIGLGIFPLDPEDEFSGIAAIGGNVLTCIPGGPCLWCAGILSKQKLENENRFGNRSYLRTALKENQGKASTPYVATFNSVLSGLAVADVAQLLLGYAPTLCFRKQYDAFTGAVSQMDVQKDESCPHCSVVSAAGDLSWS